VHEDRGKAEIGNLKIAVLVQEHVFGLEIPVADTTLVQEIYDAEQLQEEKVG
jgi:hypothetical protein